jgi:hypothetical protein
MRTPERRKMPQRRHMVTFSVKIPGLRREMLVSVGFFADNVTPGEVFVSDVQIGSDFDAVSRDAAILLSFLLQYGVPMDVVRKSVTRDARGAPSSVVGVLIDHIVDHTIPELKPSKELT